MPIVMGQRVCKQCGATFIGSQTAKYCPDCRIERSREYNRERQRQMNAPKREARPKVIYCDICGAAVPVRSGGGVVPKYCQECRDNRHSSLRKERRAQEREREKAAQVKKAKRKKPALSFSDIRALQSRREADTGRYHTYGQIAAEPYLAQQAAEMEARRRQREGR